MIRHSDGTASCMTSYAADLHLHSQFSRGTSARMTIPNLIAWARWKGIHVLGTGDFTHPQWLEEIEEYLEEDDSGLLRPKQETELRFLFTTEVETGISSLDKSSRLHLLVTAPGLEDVRSLRVALSEISDLNSEGHPSFPVPCHELVERILAASPHSLVIPCHILTPINSLYGSRSGSVSWKDCFAAMASEIHAVETGLSSDPGMCWRLSELDTKQIVSFSDAHSPHNLGREFTIFEGELSYAAFADALRGRGNTKIMGTVEYCSELGRYYFNGHRDCKIVRSPVETRFEGKRCPVCRKEITIGALQRSLELADRKAEDLDLVQERGWVQSRLLGKPPYRKMVPLREIIASSYGLKSRESQTVERIYQDALGCGASEREILLEMSESDLRSFVDHRVCEGIMRVRETRYKISPGYDGIYGRLEIFEAKETAELLQMKLFEPS
jgi:uncharacterized protein (TIGR00375 family)